MLPLFVCVFKFCSLLFKKIGVTGFQFFVHVYIKCSRFQIFSGFLKIVLHLKICSQDSKNVRALKNCLRLQICSGFFSIVLPLKISSRDSKCPCFKKLFALPNLFSISKFVLKIQKMFVLRNLFSVSKFALKIQIMFVL